VDLATAIQVVTEWLREEYENPAFSAVEAVLEIREELMDETDFNLGDDRSDTAFQMVIDARREELASELVQL
jgi:hypothetical protein